MFIWDLQWHKAHDRAGKVVFVAGSCLSKPSLIPLRLKKLRLGDLFNNDRLVTLIIDDLLLSWDEHNIPNVMIILKWLTICYQWSFFLTGPSLEPRVTNCSVLNRRQRLSARDTSFRKFNRLKNCRKAETSSPASSFSEIAKTLLSSFLYDFQRQPRRRRWRRRRWRRIGKNKKNRSFFR